MSDSISRQPERLTDDDFETIRIHLNAYKEKLCNQKRWKEAEEYQRIIDRFMAFASAQPEQQHGRIFQEIVVEYPSIGLKTVITVIKPFVASVANRAHLT